ncbi:MAG: hypothetical protein JXJ22_12380 [Bacteroidales bacterium]|nr:hypothetical protein [Bacteroidales bacterium]
MKKHHLILFSLLVFYATVWAKEKKDDIKLSPEIDSTVFSGLTFRSIGPAFTSGRIADFAVNLNNFAEYYVAVASGGIWKTNNAGITWEPVFDNYGSYSIGCVVMDPGNPNVVWAGTGENNSQRALGYGDGVYKTMDGGKSWKNMGLQTSRQIGEIIVHPENSNIVYVAAEGSLWGPGGERGLYKTIDGGTTWSAILTISENTGISDIAMDPRNPDIIYAAAHQRRRHVFTKINGGPESAIYKTTDGGKNWRKLESGLPKSHLGSIGLAVSPVNPDIVYAIVEAAYEESGFFCSTDRGESWEKRSSYIASSPQYYNELFCDPLDVDKVYSIDTYTNVTSDGGRTFINLGNERRHVDDHAVWIDPTHTSHLLIGGDGGIYETYDAGKNWHFKSNLPVTQFYRVNVDQSKPFYYVYGGTQDNNTLGGPSQNLSTSGVTNDEWFITLGGDGFWVAVDADNPDIVYSEYQYGNLYRYDRKSAEALFIKPQERKNEKTYRWNWDSPMILSSHSNTRIYCAANKVFRSDDRGNSWKVISEDLTRNMDRNSWKVMDKYWSADAIAKDISTSQYGTIVSLAESPVKEGLIYAGTDDGVIQVTEDGGKNWRKITSFPGVPEYTYVSDVYPSRFSENVVFATFNNHKNNDFKPYVLRSNDKGITWQSASKGLPENSPVNTIIQDYLQKDLLFLGAEFGVYCSVDGGNSWNALKSGIPTICVKDLVIQERENDLVVATFGRGFYILDNYSPLREITPATLEKEAYIFPVKDALMYIQKSERYGQGATYYAAKNADFGATFTYYLKNAIKTKKEERQEIEQKQFDKGEKIKVLTWDELREESNEEPPYLIFSIFDKDNQLVRKITAKAAKGMNRITWDLRYPPVDPLASLKDNKFDPFAKTNPALLVMPGVYYVSMSSSINGELNTLTEKVPFTVVPLNNVTLPAENRSEMVNFQQKVAELTRVMYGISQFNNELTEKLEFLKQANLLARNQSAEINRMISEISIKLDSIEFKMQGHQPLASKEEIPPSEVPLLQRLNSIIEAHYSSTSDITITQKKTLEILLEEFQPLYMQLKQVGEKDLPMLEEKLEEAGAPWTPGRLPKFSIN